MPPSTGALPTFTPVWPKRALSAAMARSQATTSSLPPPKAGPFTAAMTGMGAARMASKSSRLPANIDRSSQKSGSARFAR